MTVGGMGFIPERLLMMMMMMIRYYASTLWYYTINTLYCTCVHNTVYTVLKHTLYGTCIALCLPATAEASC